MAHKQERIECQICHEKKPADEMVLGATIRAAVAETIAKENPDWSPDGYICHHDLDLFRARHVEELLRQEHGELTALDREVIESLRQHELLTRNLNVQFEQRSTIGERVADRVAQFGGSWGFIGAFGLFMLIWMSINTVILLRQPFDPYPFILLNLILSCLAAIQAPIIMMSQNRQEAKDRLRSEEDYRINLKAELEIRHLRAMLDLLLSHQWQRLLEIQQIQVELLDDIAERAGKASKKSPSPPDKS
ncbi:MAG TPA: DUF1003 domain-containing protein [Thermoanaerobaculia bacterium]|nr:DUF1003 domain-containing protein [Thermoanaerobaculia bacterium]